MFKNDPLSRFSRLAWFCRSPLLRNFLRKQLKSLFFESLRANADETFNILICELILSKQPGWSFQVLELFLATPSEVIENSEALAKYFKKTQDALVADNILRTQSALVSCFDVKVLEIERALVRSSDTLSFSASDPRPMSMEDLSGQREEVLEQWFTSHKSFRGPANKNSSAFCSLVKHESETGDAMSQYILGMMHLGGYGSVAQDAQETIKWLRAAAMQGFAPAQCALGYMFYLGCEVDADPKEGEIWLKAAARSGNAIAKWALLRSDADLKKAVED
jgi:hypothetical protein